MMFHIRTRSDSKTLDRAGLGLNVEREASQLNLIQSIALIESCNPPITTNTDESRAQITRSVDVLLLRRAQTLQ